MNIKDLYAKATPGPLRVERGAEILSQDGTYVAFVNGNRDGTQPQLVNAALLAHARNVLPEVLDALKKCHEALGWAFDSKVDGDMFGINHNDATDALSNAKATIAKASEVKV